MRMTYVREQMLHNAVQYWRILKFKISHLNYYSINKDTS